MQKIKTLNNISVHPEPLLRSSSVHLKLHIIASQMERLNNTRESCMNKIEQADKKLKYLKEYYDQLKRTID